MPLPHYDVCVLPGDGIGVEVIDAALPLLERAAASVSGGSASPVAL